MTSGFQFDYVAYTCPEGFVFKGTKNTTQYAFCHDWKFHHMFDPRTSCVHAVCPQPPEFQPHQIQGERIWHKRKDVPEYGAQAQYICPEG